MNFYTQLLRNKGKEVEIYVLKNDSWFIEKGILTNIATSVGDNGVFVELDNKIFINTRYIVKIEVKDFK